jgi:hypothetical protein
MATDTSWIRHETITLIAAAMERSAVTASELAMHTGIPLATLTHKLDAGADFSFEELYWIADSLRVNPSSLVPRATAGVLA